MAALIIKKKSRSSNRSSHVRRQFMVVGFFVLLHVLYELKLIHWSVMNVIPTSSSSSTTAIARFLTEPTILVDTSLQHISAGRNSHHHENDDARLSSTKNTTNNKLTMLSCDDITSDRMQIVESIGNGKRKSALLVRYSVVSTTSESYDSDLSHRPPRSSNHTTPSLLPSSILTDNNNSNKNSNENNEDNESRLETDSTATTSIPMLAKRSKTFEGRSATANLDRSFREMERESYILQRLYEQYGDTTIRFYGSCFDYTASPSVFIDDDEQNNDSTTTDHDDDPAAVGSNSTTAEDEEVQDGFVESDGEDEDEQQMMETLMNDETYEQQDVVETGDVRASSNNNTKQRKGRNRTKRTLLSPENKKYCKRHPLKELKREKRKRRRKIRQLRQRQQKSDETSGGDIDLATEESERQVDTTKNGEDIDDADIDIDLNCTYYTSGNMTSGGATVLMEYGTPLKTKWGTINQTSFLDGADRKLPVWTLNGLEITNQTIQDMDFIAQQYTNFPDGPLVMGMVKFGRNVTRMQLLSDNMYPQQYVYVKAGLRHADVGMVFPADTSILSQELVMDMNRCITLYTALGVKYWKDPSMYTGGRRRTYADGYNCQKEFNIRKNWLP